MEQTGTFPEGILVDGVAHCGFVLAEKTFRHTLAIGNDRTLDRTRINDPVYYDACLYAKRLRVEGIDQLTPDQVLDLSGPDGDELIFAELELESRRQAFRGAAEAAQEKAGSPP